MVAGQPFWHIYFHFTAFDTNAGSQLAIPGRLELPTYGLGNRRSIRLSYGTEDPLQPPRVPGNPIAERAHGRKFNTTG
jgi:hypothetical protein